MRWSPQQDDALRAAARWYTDPGAPQVFRLFGYAGTGKSTLARTIADDLADGRAEYAAFTGKAALVMRRMGCVGARTIHSLIYTPEDGEHGEPHFVLNPNGPLVGAKLCVIDECSMVDETLANDLLSFGVKILVLGDPAQLPPVRGAGYFTDAPPDAMLTEVHRQALDSPIIRLATTVREGGSIASEESGVLRVVSRVGADEVLGADQILVGRNATRVAHNRRLRDLHGLDPSGPVVKDKLVCLQNNRQKCLLNGLICDVERITVKRDRYIRMTVRPEDDGAPVDVAVRNEFFAGGESALSWDERRNFDEFTYGYALTVHKAQGSQWPSVVLFDESRCFREDRARWLYTGVTRAAEKLTVVIQT